MIGVDNPPAFLYAFVWRNPNLFWTELTAREARPISSINLQKVRFWWAVWESNLYSLQC